MEDKVNELMNAPLGHLVKIGRLYYAAIEFLPQGNTKGNVCVGCSFRDDGGGIEECRYSSACEERLKESKSISQSRPSSVTPTKVRAGIEWVKGVSEMLNLNDVSKLSLLEKVATPLGLPLPDYVPSKGVMKSATDLLNEKGYKVSRNQFYKRAIELGYIERISRKSSKGKIKYFNSISKKGLEYGENQINKNNPKETQPEWYVDKFDSLMLVLGFSKMEELSYAG